MKIVIFNGSPKRNASDTMHITRAFVSGINEVTDNDCSIVDVIDRHIEYCNGCLACMSNNGTCIYKDDMKEILDEICVSDVLIFSFPLYCYGMPGHLKTLIDRLIPLTGKRMNSKGDHYEHLYRQDFTSKKFVMISGCGFPNSEHNFEAVSKQFEMMFRNDNTIITVPEAPMFNAQEASPVTDPFKNILKQAGREFALEGHISEITKELLLVPMISQEEYVRICNSAC